VERQIAIAEVNGRLFLNNVSLGIYGKAVRRSAYRDAKVRTLLETADRVLGPGAQAPALRLADDLGHDHRHLAIVLVSNNPYALGDSPAPGTRPALDTGQLGIVVLDVPGDSRRAPGRAWTAPRLEVSAPETVHAGVDGEAVDLSPPLGRPGGTKPPCGRDRSRCRRSRRHWASGPAVAVLAPACRARQHSGDRRAGATQAVDTVRNSRHVGPAAGHGPLIDRSCTRDSPPVSPSMMPRPSGVVSAGAA
jgi:hypothetical protein